MKRADAGFNENDHPRDKDGKFISGGGSGFEKKSQTGSKAKTIQKEGLAGANKSVKNKVAKNPVDVSGYAFADYRNPDGKNMPGCETYRSAMRWKANETEKVFDRVLKTYGGEMPPYKQASAAFNEINKHSAVRDIVSPGSEQGLKDCSMAISLRQNYLMDKLKDYNKWDRNKRMWVKG